MRPLFFLLFCGCVSAQLTPLDDYVRRDDATFSYRLMQTREYVDYTVYSFNLTSQTWMNTDEVQDPVWWHWLSLVVPDVLDPTLDTCFLHLGEGSNTEQSPPDPESSPRLVQGVRLARSTNAPFAYLRQTPNQPVYFTKDNSSRGRYEDDAIAYTWRRFIDDPSGTSPDLLMRMPMTKGAVMAMDAVMEFALLSLTQPVARFFVSGGSKRGWTTYTVAATDPVPGRVFAIAPKVISILNVQPNFHHHRQSLGGWSFALNDYYNEGLLGDVDHPNVPLLASIVEPYSYLSRLTMPKFMVGGSSDEFFLPDSYRHFWNDVLEPKRLWMVENTGHCTACSHRFDNIWDAMKNFYIFAARGEPYPTMTWTHSESATDGTVTATVSEVPVAIRAWVANSISTVRRDFRRMAGLPPTETGVVWNATSVTRDDIFQYSVTIPKPSSGWRAFYIEAEFAGLFGSTAPSERLYFSTEVNIIPDTLPFPRCSGWADCQGTLV